MEFSINSLIDIFFIELVEIHFEISKQRINLDGYKSYIGMGSSSAFYLLPPSIIGSPTTK